MSLWEMFKEQKKHNRHFVNYEALTDEERTQLTKDYVLLAVDELIELLRCVEYKKHRTQRVEHDKANILEEVIDVFKYLLSICHIYDIELMEFIEMFFDKSEVVEQRYQQEHIELTEHTKLICVDLDGVIADWSRGIYDWYHGRDSYYEDGYRHHSSYDIGCLFDLDKVEAEKLKLDFMLTGQFRKLPVVANADWGMQELKDMGYKLAIVTARPYLEHRRVYADTLQWLKDKGIPHDFIFWGKDKADIVFRELSPVRPAWFIEDRDKHAIELANEGIRVILLDWPYNRILGEDIPNVTRVGCWHDLITEVITE
jgi:dimeric dUTPase (all-alpha-NTP-PPase superfamily)/uncharacterized HAD superfamily protein